MRRRAEALIGFNLRDRGNVRGTHFPEDGEIRRTTDNDLCPREDLQKITSDLSGMIYNNNKKYKNNIRI